jgi:hypothetical protein
MEQGSLAAAWNNALLPKNAESNVHKTLSYAPRGLRCTWRDCPYLDDPFDSLQALIQVADLFYCFGDLLINLVLPTCIAHEEEACRTVSSIIGTLSS